MDADNRIKNGEFRAKIDFLAETLDRKSGSALFADNPTGVTIRTLQNAYDRDKAPTANAKQWPELLNHWLNGMEPNWFTGDLPLDTFKSRVKKLAATHAPSALSISWPGADAPTADATDLIRIADGLEGVFQVVRRYNGDSTLAIEVLAFSRVRNGGIGCAHITRTGDIYRGVCYPSQPMLYLQLFRPHKAYQFATRTIYARIPGKTRFDFMTGLMLRTTSSAGKLMSSPLVIRRTSSGLRGKELRRNLADYIALRDTATIQMTGASGNERTPENVEELRQAAPAWFGEITNKGLDEELYGKLDKHLGGKALFAVMPEAAVEEWRNLNLPADLCASAKKK